jgi:phage terminase small subunit
MPTLSNPKWERFAQAIVKGLNGRAAYNDAGYEVGSASAADVSASRLLKNPNVAARIAELQARIVGDILVSRQKTLEELATIAYAPLGHEVVKVADKRAALMDIAKLEGWVVERSEHGKPGDFDRLTEDELDRFIAQREGRASGGVPRKGTTPGARASVPTGRPN